MPAVETTSGCLTALTLARLGVSPSYLSAIAERTGAPSMGNRSSPVSEYIFGAGRDL